MFEYFYAGLQNHIGSLLRVVLVLILWGIALRVGRSSDLLCHGLCAIR